MKEAVDLATGLPSKHESQSAETNKHEGCICNAEEVNRRIVDSLALPVGCVKLTQKNYR
jgi:hypothetical protein